MTAQAHEIDETPELGASLDHQIAALTRNVGGMSPLARLAFHGAVGAADAQHIAQHMRPDQRGTSLGRSPLEFFAFQAKDKLDEWEYLAGMKFRADFDAAHEVSKGVARMDRLDLYATELAAKHRAAGYHGKGAARQVSVADVSIGRLDAMRRRGALAQRSLTSFWLAEQIIGNEFWPKDVAAFLQLDPRYVGPRFREALADLAGFYRLHVRSTARSRVQVYHADEMAPAGA